MAMGCSLSQDALGIDHIPLSAAAPSYDGLSRASDSYRGSTSGTRSWNARNQIVNKRVSPEEIRELPAHIAGECARLNDMFKDGVVLTEPVCRPLVNSVCIWLLLKGVTNKTDHPDVFAKVSRLLHAQIPLDKLAPAGRALNKGKGKPPTNFERRIHNWMVNHVRGSDSKFRLEIAFGTTLNDVMQGLLHAKVAVLLQEGETPKPGHWYASPNITRASCMCDSHNSNTTFACAQWYRHHEVHEPK